MTDLSESQLQGRLAARARGGRADRTRRGPWLQLFDPVGYEWNRVRLPIRGLSSALAGLRIVHLSDLHLRDRWLTALDSVIQRLADDPPDLLICTGDFIENKKNHLPALPNVKRLLDGCISRLGCFGVMGNHDGKLADDLPAHQIMLLDRGTHTISVNGAKIELLGFPRLLRRERANPDFVPVLPPRARGDLRMVLSHHPDYLPLCGELAPDLFLTGHTHGGQLCLPGGFAMITHSPLPRRLCCGVHETHDTWLIANRGFGFSGLPIRLFCPAEVVEIELTRG